jgi:protocatechuate 3,4-dioxygenase beta subunit
MSKKKLSRRTLVQLGLGAAAGTVTGAAMAANPADPECTTPAQTAGPFFPKRDRPDKDADMTRVAGRSDQAEGEIIYIVGRVVDHDFAPVGGALVDVWQANTHGRYDHEDDPNPAPLDPNFQGWAQLVTDADGGFTVKTILPGAYPVGENWTRPPHVHFKIARRGYRELTTQMYFDGQELNDVDRLLLEIPEEERQRVIVSLEDPADEAMRDGKVCRFTIAIERFDSA